MFKTGIYISIKATHEDRSGRITVLRTFPECSTEHCRLLGPDSTDKTEKRLESDAFFIEELLDADKDPQFVHGVLIRADLTVTQRSASLQSSIFPAAWPVCIENI